ARVLTRTRPPPSTLFPYTTLFRSPEKLQLLQLRMNRAWAQQKYRANLKNKKKKQSTYALSMEAKSQLQILAKKSNVNLNQMLEYIIDQAFKNHKKGKPEG